MRDNRHAPDAVLGAVLMLVGALLVLDRLNLLQAWQVLRFWPLAVVGAGMALLLDRYDSLPPNAKGNGHDAHRF